MNQKQGNDKMKMIKFLAPLSLILLISCSSDNDFVSMQNKEKISSQLKSIALENLKSWEPPFHENQFLSHFTQSDDLLIVIDDFTIKNYDKWKGLVFESMNEDRNQQFKMYKHIVNEVNVVVLSASSGVVTTSYTWDYITNENLHFNVKANATLVFRKNNEHWEIVHFIVSHQKENQIK